MLHRANEEGFGFDFERLPMDQTDGLDRMSNPKNGATLLLPKPSKGPELRGDCHCPPVLILSLCPLIRAWSGG